MSEHSRRSLLKQAAALGAALAFGRSCAHTTTGPRTERRDLYPQGVASGDPQADSVILWTRRPFERGAGPAPLVVEVALDPDFRRVVATADAPAHEESDWTCRVLVGNRAFMESRGVDGIQGVQAHGAGSA